MNEPFKNSRYQWVAGFSGLTRTLDATNGQFGIILNNEHTSSLIASLREIGVSTADVGLIATDGSKIALESKIRDDLDGIVVLTDLGVIFDKGSKLDPVRFLRSLTRRGPRLAVWPGEMNQGRLVYGEPQSSHRFEWDPENVVILTPVSRDYPDEAPFRERWIN